MPWLWALLVGIGTSIFPMVLTLIGLRARTSEGTAALSGFAQSIGYLIAGLGPFMMGALYGATGGWTLPLLVLIVLVIPLSIGAVLLCRERYLEDELATWMRVPGRQRLPAQLAPRLKIGPFIALVTQMRILIAIMVVVAAAEVDRADVHQLCGVPTERAEQAPRLSSRGSLRPAQEERVVFGHQHRVGQHQGAHRVEHPDDVDPRIGRFDAPRRRRTMA